MPTSRRRRVCCLFPALAFLFLAASGGTVLADRHAAEEYRVKAAFLYNFTKFVEWPEIVFRDASDPFVIAVLGEDPFGSALDILKGKTVNGRPLIVRRAAAIGELGRFHLLFVAASERSRLASVLPAAHAMHALTVGDVKGFAEQGGAIQLVRDGDRIGFRVNQDASRRAELKVSSKLLALARAVTGGDGK
jgi:hypothetical protein